MTQKTAAAWRSRDPVTDPAFEARSRHDGLVDEMPDVPVMASLQLEISGLGMILYSPSSAAHISEGEDYLTSSYWEPQDVQHHVEQGYIVGFSTGSPGYYKLDIFRGYPAPDEFDEAEMKLRLVVRADERLVFRDLYDLMEWSAVYPEPQAIDIDSGIYHVTVLSDIPASGTLGDHQTISIYLAQLPNFPPMRYSGVPSLC
ncbi:MAG: hypothetical protein M3450_05160 [Actinomycetota bacterium]|nr:hypothetical protein [Actinomycetota bacterium]